VQTAICEFLLTKAEMAYYNWKNWEYFTSILLG